MLKNITCKAHMNTQRKYSESVNNISLGVSWEGKVLMHFWVHGVEKIQGKREEEKEEGVGEEKEGEKEERKAGRKKTDTEN